MSKTESLAHSSELECAVMDLRATTTILDAMITAAHENYGFNEKEDFAWAKVAGELSDLTQRVVNLWEAARERHNEHIKALKDEYAEEIASLKAKLAAADEPLSGARLERLEALQGMLRGMAKVIINTLDGKSVSILKGLIEGAAEREPEPPTAPQPERLRW